jgi:DNA-binding response OmpR family regulator
VTSVVVLVADDDDDILLLVTTRLRRDGFEVIAARNGEEALALAKEQLPDIAVLDIGMPKLDGLEVLERMRADELLKGIRVLLLTAKAQESDVRRGYEAGADAYVRKPFSPAELSTRVLELASDLQEEREGKV